MQRRTYSTVPKWEAAAGYSRAVRIGNIVETSLTSAALPTGEILHVGDVYGQTKESIRICGEALAALGASFADVIKTRIYMLDTKQWLDAGRAHAETFAAIRPAISFIGVSGFFHPDLAVEVQMTAVLSS